MALEKVAINPEEFIGEYVYSELKDKVLALTGISYPQFPDNKLGGLDKVLDLYKSDIEHLTPENLVIGLRTINELGFNQGSIVVLNTIQYPGLTKTVLWIESTVYYTQN